MPAAVRNNPGKPGRKPAAPKQEVSACADDLRERYENALKRAQWWEKRADARGRTCTNRFGDQVMSVWAEGELKWNTHLLAVMKEMRAAGLAEEVEYVHDGPTLSIVKGTR